MVAQSKGFVAIRHPFRKQLAKLYSCLTVLVMPNQMSDPDNMPCLIGTGRRTWHPSGEPAPEPLEMWELVASTAAADAGIDRDVMSAVDDLNLVHCQSWAYDDPAGHLAGRLGLSGARQQESILAGTSPQRLIDGAAERMLRGETKVALVVGGEAFATLRTHKRDGRTPPWSYPHPAPPSFPVDLDEWYLPTEIAHGVLPAWLTFALLEQARWAGRGALPEDSARLGTVMSRLNDVAAANPDAWFPEALSIDEITRPTPGNRMIATPYTKRMTAFMDVDMAAANLLVTRGTADAWGVPDERRVYLRGWGFARDAVHLGARSDLTSSPGMRVATGEALRMAGMTVDEVSAFDLYSCFGSAVQFAQDALGLSVDDPRPMSLTGGLPYHGGPSSNYMGHSISHMADHLRADPARVGMVTGVGMHMTKHVAAVWSATPGPLDPPEHEQGEQRWGGDSESTDIVVVDRAEGSAVILAATVAHGTHGSPSHAVAICELADGTRCYARSDRADMVSAIEDGSAWVDAKVSIRRGTDDTNDFVF